MEFISINYNDNIMTHIFISKRKCIWLYITLSALCFLPLISMSQDLPSGYEVRYFSKDPAANGETDFKGETSTLTTEQRIELLKYFADQAAAYYGDEELNTEVVTDREAADFYKSIRPQPLPEVRKRIRLESWKWISSNDGKHEESIWDIDKYKGARNILINNGTMIFNGSSDWKWDFLIQTWRWSVSWKVRMAGNSPAAEFNLLNSETDKIFARITMEKKSFTCYSKGERSTGINCEPGEWHEIKIEADMDGDNGGQFYNVYLDNRLVCDYIEANETVQQVNAFSIIVSGEGGTEVDDIYGVGYHRTTEVRHPYYPKTFIDERFDIEPCLEGWKTASYDDSKWETSKLPIARGTERYAGEDLYLRKKIKLQEINRAYLNIETLDPGGEIWVNGKMAALIKERYPVRVDLTDYLIPFSENIITLRVYSFYLNLSVGVKFPCSYLDYNAGWFAGRASLDLVGETFINDAFVYTKKIENNKADVHAKIDLEHSGTLAFKGNIKVKMCLWDDSQPKDIKILAIDSVLTGPGITEYNFDFTMDDPSLWTPELPLLYKVIVEVEDKDGEIIDDYVFTTGIRTVSQEWGTFHLNGKPAMLNGTQIMGFRSPLENMMTWLRCPPDYWVAKEMLMTREMNCNMLRVHVHGWKEKAIGVNDERYCELADQMGIMLIWCSPAWIREGDWGQIDFDGYHKYMKQVRNHPGIVMWEVSNHPNTFKDHEPYESDLFCEESYNAVYPYDPSRLISFTSHIGHLHYGNDEGTIDQGGKKIPSEVRAKADVGNQDALTSYGTKNEFSGDSISSSRAWTAPMVTRGNQDAATGYGAAWSRLREWPGAYRQGFLDSKERAYFNFEHQESIGQPNWSLCRGKPWYLLQSYEWGYDEGSIGRKLQSDEWRISQAWQAFSAYEAIKKMRMLDYDGFSWCCLHGGANAGTYKKPVIDFLGHAKLAFHIHKTVFEPVLAGSNNVDVVYGPADSITPMILNLGEEKNVDLTVIVKDKLHGREIDRKTYENIRLPAGRTVTEADPFIPEFKDEGLYFIEYYTNHRD